MKDDIVANENHHPPAPAEAGSEVVDARRAARRRFAKAGLGATGVILTLTSKPGMAANGCTSMSGFGSHPSGSHAPAGACEGRSPGYWKNWEGEWQGAYTSPNAKFGDIFTGTPAPPALAGMTLMNVLDPNGNNGGGNGNGNGNKDKDNGKDKGKAGSTAPGPTAPSVDPDPDNVARHIIAALLNARSQRVSQPTERDIFEIWNQYAATGAYKPRPDVIWRGPDIVIYLKSTMI